MRKTRIDWDEISRSEDLEFALPRDKKLRRLLDTSVILIDRREQNSWKFERSLVTELKTGDYSFYTDIFDFRDIFAVERKASPDELIDMVGRERERWESELERMKGIPYKAVICEFSLEDLEIAVSSRQVALTAVWGSLISWQIMKGIPFLFAGSRKTARRIFLKAVEFVLKSHWIKED